MSKFVKGVAIVVATIIMLPVVAGFIVGATEGIVTTVKQAQAPHPAVAATDLDITWTNTNWARPLAAPDQYHGEGADIVGRVMHVERRGQGWRVEIQTNVPRFDQGRAIILGGPPNATPLEGDYIQVRGTLTDWVAAESWVRSGQPAPTIQATSVQRITKAQAEAS